MVSFVYIDPSQLGGSGSQVNPYGADAGSTYLNRLTNSDQSGVTILVRSGTFWRPTSQPFRNAPSNFTIGAYGTGAYPIIAGSAIKSGTWTLTTGTTWQIPHTNASQMWAYGGQATNGFGGYTNNPRNVPYGQRLAFASSSANVEATPFTSYCDGTNVYVNLGGANPNALVMEYTSLTTVLGYGPGGANGGGRTNFLDLTLAMGQTGLAWYWTSKASNVLIRAINVDQCGALPQSAFPALPSGVGIWINGNQGNGAEPSVMLRGLVIDGCVVTNTNGDGIDILGVDGAFVHNTSIDNSTAGLTLWNNVTNSEFRALKITNIAYPTVTTGLVSSSGFECEPASGGGGNGSFWNNKIFGLQVVNPQAASVKILSGWGWLFDHCSIITTPGSSPVFPAIQIQPTTGAADNPEVRITNTWVHADNSSTTGVAIAGGSFNSSGLGCYISGDYNYYTFAAALARLNYNNGTTATTIAGWRSGIGAEGSGSLASQMDQHSGLSISVSTFSGLAGVYCKAFPTAFSANPCGAAGLPSNAYIPPSSVDLTPVSSNLLGKGNCYWTTDTPAPLLAPVVTAASNASSTWTTGTWYFVIDFIGPNGHTLQSPVGSVAVTSGSTSPSIAAPLSVPSWAIGMNVFAGQIPNGPWYQQNTLAAPTESSFACPNAPIIAGTSGHIPNAIEPALRGGYLVPTEDGNGNLFDVLTSNACDIGAISVS